MKREIDGMAKKDNNKVKESTSARKWGRIYIIYHTYSENKQQKEKEHLHHGMTIFFANLQSFQRRLFCTLRCSGRYKFRRNFSWRKENATDKQGKKMLHIKEKKQYDKYELTILIHFERMSGPDKSYLSKFLCDFLFHSKSPGFEPDLHARRSQWVLPVVKDPVLRVTHRLQSTKPGSRNIITDSEDMTMPCGA